MSAIEDRLLKLREERAAREKARIEKLRELNLKKYNRNENTAPNLPQKLIKSNSVSQIKTNAVKNIQNATKRPITAPIPKNNIKGDVKIIKEKTESKINYLQKNIVAIKGIESKDLKVKNEATNDAKVDKTNPIDKKVITNKINNDKLFDRKTAVKTDKILAEVKPFKKIDPKLTRKSLAVPQVQTNIPVARKSMMKLDSKETVFDRLYKPKCTVKTTLNKVEKLQTDPNFLKKVIKNSGLIVKRHTCFETKVDNNPVRRSISAVHFKRISKDEVNNCIHKWASIGDKLNKQHLTLDEIKEEKICSAVKSERKKVKFMTPMSRLNTPKPEELQMRLKSWLQKRGKSLDAYHHLQCFGIHHLKPKPLELSTLKYQPYDEENKENIAVDSDSDDGSYTDNMVKQKDTLSEGNIDVDKWRQDASESMYTEFNETADLNETTVTSADTYMNVDELLMGALNDLAELLREGFDWEQSARYLRAIRSRFPEAPRTAAYWECRAALEERRGDLHASVQCWEEAIAKGTERNVVEANLDTLLNKFMQLKISPNTAANKRPNPKMVDVKNVFKSTIIRFAVQQAKLRQSETPIFTVTPVRRSGRLSLCPTPRNKVSTPFGNKPNGNTPRNKTKSPLANNADSKIGDVTLGNKNGDVTLCNKNNDVTLCNKNNDVTLCNSNGDASGNIDDHDKSEPIVNKIDSNIPIGNKAGKRNTRAPLQLCDSVKQVSMLVPKHVFTPNKNFVHTP